MFGSTSLAENLLDLGTAPPRGGSDVPGAAPAVQRSFAHRLSAARANTALDEQDPRRRTRSDIAALAVHELSSRQDNSPSAAVKTAESALAQDRAGTSSPKFAAQPRTTGGSGISEQARSPVSSASPRTEVAPGDSASHEPRDPAQASASGASEAPAAIGLSPRAAAQDPQESAAIPVAATPAVAVTPPQAAAPAAPSGTPAAAPVSKAGDARPHTAAIRRPAPPPRPFQLEESGFAQQVSRAMAASLRQRGGTVTMRLAPDALGQVRVALTLDSGRVDATFEASTDQARRLLNDNMTALRAALEAHGLTVDRLGVAPTEGPAHHDPGTGSLSDSGGGREHSQSASEHAGNHAQARGMDVRGLTQGDDPAEPARQGPALTGGARTIRLRLDAVA